MKKLFNRTKEAAKTEEAKVEGEEAVSDETKGSSKGKKVLIAGLTGLGLLALGGVVAVIKGRKSGDDDFDSEEEDDVDIFDSDDSESSSED